MWLREDPFVFQSTVTNVRNHWLNYSYYMQKIHSFVRFKIYLFICVCVYVKVMSWVCRYPQNPENGIRVSKAGVTGGWLWDATNGRLGT